MRRHRPGFLLDRNKSALLLTSHRTQLGYSKINLTMIKNYSVFNIYEFKLCLIQTHAV